MKPKFSARRLKLARKSKGLTQLQLSDAAGVSKQQLARWERGDTSAEPKGSILALMATAEGVTPAWLLGEGDDRPPVLSLAIPALVLTPKETQYVLACRGAPLDVQTLMSAYLIDATTVANVMKSAPGVKHEREVFKIELQAQNEELRRVQVELAAEKARYFELYELAPMGYCTLNAKGLLTECNLAASKMLGLPRAKLLAHHALSHHILPEDQDVYFAKRKEALASGERVVFEVRMRKVQGAMFRALVAIISLSGGLRVTFNGVLD